jgi:transposase
VTVTHFLVARRLLEMPSSPEKRQRESLLHLWNIGIRNAKELHTRTKVPLSTIYHNIAKFKKTRSAEHLKGKGRPGKINREAALLLGQYIRRDPTISTRSLAIKLLKKGINVSYRTIGRHLDNMGYKKSLPRATPMLTEVHKQKRVEWAKKYRNKHWSRVLFSDETAFQLFRNTVERWHKNAQPIRPMPKDRRKIFAWGASVW